MTVAEVKAKLLALLDEVENGAEIEVTRHGRTVARPSAATGPHSRRSTFEGLAMSAASGPITIRMKKLQIAARMNPDRTPNANWSGSTNGMLSMNDVSA